jgi:hypothetical protein
VINIRPYTYQEGTKAALKSIEQQRIFAVVSNDDMPDAEKIERFGSSFLRLTELTVDVVCGCISSIDTPDGTVDDAAQIKEFINNCPKDIFDKIQTHLTSMRAGMEFKVKNVACGECSTVFDIPITMDNSNFFAVRSPD